MCSFFFKIHSMLESISSSFTKWNKHMMDTRDYQVSFTFGPCDYQQEVSLRVHLLDFISKAVGVLFFCFF